MGNQLFQLLTLHLQVLFIAQLVDQVNSHQHRLRQEVGGELALLRIQLHTDGLLNLDSRRCIK